MLKHAMAGMVAALALAAPGVAGADYYSGLKAFDSRQYALAAKEWEAAARGGDAKSAFRLGKLYQDGRGVKRDYARAYFWFKVSEARGNVDAGIAAHFVGQKLSAAQRNQIAARAKQGAGGTGGGTGGGDGGNGGAGGNGGGAGGGDGPFGNMAGMELRRTFQDADYNRSEIWRFDAGGKLRAVATLTTSGSNSRVEQDSDSGAWSIEGGKLCVKWNKWNDSRKICYSGVKRGKIWKITSSAGRTTTAYIAKQ